MIERIFALDGVVLYICDRDQLYSSTSELPMSIQASLRAMTESHNLAQTVPGGFLAMTLMLGLRRWEHWACARQCFPTKCYGGQRPGGHRAHTRHGH